MAMKTSPDSGAVPTIQVDDWHGCYGEAWGNARTVKQQCEQTVSLDLIVDETTTCLDSDIHPDAISHPAKFSRALIRKIYQHCAEEGWSEPGSVVCDPFGGAALGALGAMRLGCTWIGCELEPRFVELGRKNIELWNAKYGTLQNWGSAVLLQGDSRKFARLITEADVSISSPPYMEPRGHPSLGHPETHGYAGGSITNFATTGQNPGDEYYGKTPGQIANMPEGNLDVAISSPPYAGNQKHDTTHIDRDERNLGEGFKGRGRGSFRGSENYGNDPAQLGNMPEGSLDACISSPPFAGTVLHDGGPVKKSHTGELFSDYGNSPGQLAHMVISSPPFLANSGGTNVTAKEGPLADAALLKRQAAGNASAGYGDSEGQLSAMPHGDVDCVISSPPYGGKDETGGGPGAHEYGGKAQFRRSGYSDTPENISNLPHGDIDACVSSPPFGKAQDGGPVAWDKIEGDHGRKYSGSSRRRPFSAEEQGSSDGQLAQTEGEDFWSASRLIVEQVYSVLRPGAHACWVVKGFVRNREYVDFPGQWRRLCEAVGFRTLHEHHALLVEERGTQVNTDGEAETKIVQWKSFFRRLAEKNGAPPVDFEVVYCMEKQE